VPVLLAIVELVTVNGVLPIYDDVLDRVVAYVEPIMVNAAEALEKITLLPEGRCCRRTRRG
jgi:hypothetical protein